MANHPIYEAALLESSPEGESVKTISERGTIFWKNKKDRLHRENGPAEIHPDGHQEWWVDGRCHRENGPAIIKSNGSQFWWLNGECHREDGPAEIYTDGFVEYWWRGKRITSSKNNSPRILKRFLKIVKEFKIKEVLDI